MAYRLIAFDTRDSHHRYWQPEGVYQEQNRLKKGAHGMPL